MYITLISFYFDVCTHIDSFKEQEAERSGDEHLMKMSIVVRVSTLIFHIYRGLFCLCL